MKLAVICHKVCWRDPSSPTGFSTDGGFPMQMEAISELFDETRLVNPVLERTKADQGLSPIRGHNLSVIPLPKPTGTDLRRKLSIIPWLIQCWPVLKRQIAWADAIHAPGPGDISAFGMWGAQLAGKPLFVRHCGNWLAPRTLFERYYKWHIERFAGGRNAMFATGGTDDLPSPANPEVRWIFSTSMSAADIDRATPRINDADARKSPAETGPRLIIAARQDPAKGGGVLVEAMPGILRDFPQASLDIVGDGQGIAQFRERSQALGLNGSVRFHGKISQPQVIEAIRQADLFVFPTAASDGFPKAVHEALACGLPVIATKVSVLPKLLRQGGGVLLDQRTPEAIRRAVKHCVEDDQRYQSLSKQAVEVAKAYTLERWQDEIRLQLSETWNRQLRDPLNQEVLL